jgi:hypothetical protein
MPANTPSPAPKVVVVGIDGVRYDTLLSAATAAVDRIAAAGFLGRLRVNDAGITVSGPSRATIVAGVLTSRHRIVNNTFTGHALAEWPDFATRVRAADAGAATLAVAAWPPLSTATAGGPMLVSAVSPVVEPPHSAKDWNAADDKVARRTAGFVATVRPDQQAAAFCYLGLPDAVCHDVGVTEGYREAIEASDRRLAVIDDAIRARADAAAWTVILATDHGHVDVGGHGGESDEERTAWIAARGPGVPPGLAPAALEQAGVAAHALSVLGFDPVKLGLFGTPFHTRG